MTNAGPNYEGANQVYRVSRRELGPELRTDVRLSFRVDEKVAQTERNRRSWRQIDWFAQRRDVSDPVQNFRGQDDLVIDLAVCLELSQDRVHLTSLRTRVVHIRERSSQLASRVSRQTL